MPKKITKNNDFYSVSELADLLEISRVAVFKKIKKGQIKAFKIGRNYAIPKRELGVIHGSELKAKEKKIIDQAMRRIVKEYGETLKLLSAE